MSKWFEQLSVDVSSSPWFNAWRQEAHKTFERQGMPHNKQEDWKYAPLKHLYAQDFHLKDLACFEHSNLALDAHFVFCKNQKTFLEHVGVLPEGVMILPLQEALLSHAEIVQAYLGRIAKNQHGFVSLNSCLFQAGVMIYLPAGVVLEKPVVIHHQTESNVISHIRHLVIAENDAKIDVMEYFDSQEGHGGFINQVTEMFLAPSAQCQHLKVQNLSSEAMLQSELFVSQEKSSHFDSFLIQKGGHYASCDAYLELKEQAARAQFNGVFQAIQHQTHQQRLRVLHQHDHCYSAQNFRGILDDKAQGVFIGQVFVAKGAIKTEAHQSNKNLLLSKHAQMITCPQLEIFADDVVCSHGATVGTLDDDALFYLQARGLMKSRAKALLIHAFIKELFDEIPVEAFKTVCLQLLSEQ